jgi:hypothetical protein
MPDIDAVIDVLHDFESLLRRHGVAIANGSRLEAAILFAAHVQYVRAQEAVINESEDERFRWRELSGIWDLARKLLYADRHHHRKFLWLVPLLRLFASEGGQLAQLAPTSAGDQDADKAFELLSGTSLLPVVSALETDRGDGANPDLLVRFRWKRWGIACKRLHTTSSARFRDPVSKGIQQIERSEAERGLVFVHLTDLLDHDLFFPRTPSGDGYVGMSTGAMHEVLESEKARIQAATLQPVDQDLAVVFEGRKAMPGLIHYVGFSYLGGTADAPSQRAVQHAWSRGHVDAALLHAFQAGLNPRR